MPNLDDITDKSNRGNYPFQMRKKVATLITIVFLVSLGLTANAAVKPGTSCKKLGQTSISYGKKYTCVKNGKKLIWNKGLLYVKPTPLPDLTPINRPSASPVVTPTPTPTPTPTKIYEPNWFREVLPTVHQTIVDYTTFDNEKVKLYPWEGKKIAILTLKSNLDPKIMGLLIRSLDNSYETYKELTGFEPVTVKNYNGKLLIAEIPTGFKNCGAGCGYLGASGIQINEANFTQLYEGIKNNNQFDQVLYYELGRNFWNYSSWYSKLAFKENDSVVTGFAVLMRFVVMQTNDIPIARFYEYSGQEFLNVVKRLASKYRSSPQFTFKNTFAISKSPGELGTSDLWASIMMDFASRYGENNFYKKFFESIQSLPQANTTLDAIKNWETALTKASGIDVSKEFSETWKMYN